MTHRTEMMTIVINHDASYTIDDNRHNHNASYTNDDNCHDRIVHTLAIDDAAEILFRTNKAILGVGWIPCQHVGLHLHSSNPVAGGPPVGSGTAMSIITFLNIVSCIVLLTVPRTRIPFKSARTFERDLVAAALVVL